MKTYLVGGAVRDELLGLPVGERDYVVVGATPGEMEQQGFRRVGKDFPVYLHPETSEEYALARTERKTGAGYTGFAFDTDPAVTLEEDLQRRDLTVNALARAPDGELIDPWGGHADLQQRILRHVSPAFAEDPVRVLRAARFAARFAPQGFRVADETLTLMRDMVAAGEVDALTPERVWKETEKALLSPAPRVYFEVLRDCAALAVIFPEIEALFGVPQPAQWHPEIDCGLHTLMVVEQAALLSPDPQVRFAALLHDLGKAATPPDELPSHRGHEQRSLPLINGLCDRLRVPREYRELALQVAEHHGVVHRIAEVRPATLLKLLQRLDALRRPARFERFVLSCEADARGRAGLEQQPYPQAEQLRAALAAMRSVNPKVLGLAGMDGEAAKKTLYEARLRALKEHLRGDP